MLFILFIQIINHSKSKEREINDNFENKFDYVNIQDIVRSYKNYLIKVNE